MKTILVENSSRFNGSIDVGQYNGYVILPKGHPYHGKDYDDIPVEVHGGLTFAASASNLIKEFGILPEDKEGWIVGFDTCHYGDTAAKWTKEKVQAETDRLAEQLKTITPETVKPTLEEQRNELLRCCKLALSHGKWDDYSAGTPYYQILQAIEKAEK